MKKGYLESARRGIYLQIGLEDLEGLHLQYFRRIMPTPLRAAGLGWQRARSGVRMINA